MKYIDLEPYHPSEIEEEIPITTGSEEELRISILDSVEVTLLSELLRD